MSFVHLICLMHWCSVSTSIMNQATIVTVQGTFQFRVSVPTCCRRIAASRCFGWDSGADEPALFRREKETTVLDESQR